MKLLHLNVLRWNLLGRTNIRKSQLWKGGCERLGREGNINLDVITTSANCTKHFLLFISDAFSPLRSSTLKELCDLSYAKIFIKEEARNTIFCIYIHLYYNIYISLALKLFDIKKMQWKCFHHIPVRTSKPPASHFTVYLTFYMNIIIH